MKWRGLVAVFWICYFNDTVFC